MEGRKELAIDILDMQNGVQEVLWANLIINSYLQHINFDLPIIKQEIDCDDGYQGMRKVPSLSDVSDPDASDGKCSSSYEIITIKLSDQMARIRR